MVVGRLSFFGIWNNLIEVPRWKLLNVAYGYSDNEARVSPVAVELDVVLSRLFFCGLLVYLNRPRSLDGPVEGGV